MSGHSKWHNIQAKKGKTDAKRGKIFTKIGKELMVAVKEGGPNPDANSRLRDVISKAKANNMPNDNIMRSIKKASGDADGVSYEELTYEGYGPCGVAIIVSVLTDNKNRSASTVRHAFDRSGGNLGANGCVSWMFERKGQIIIHKNDDMNEDEMMEVALEAGAEDFSALDEEFEIITLPNDFSDVRENLEKAGYKFEYSEITMIPNNTVSLDLKDSEKIQRIIDKLEDDDDVQAVYHNANFPDEFKG